MVNRVCSAFFKGTALPIFLVLTIVPMVYADSRLRAMNTVANTPVSQAQSFGATLYKKSAGAVVVLYGFDRKGAGTSGAGFFVTGSGQGGHILTHAINVIDPATGKPWRTLAAYRKPAVLTGDLEQDLAAPLELTVQAVHQELGLALLQLSEPRSNPAALELDCAQEIEVGSEVLSIGHGLGSFWSAATGIINNRGVDAERSFLLTNTGVSLDGLGSPVVDRSGCAVGLHSGKRVAPDGRHLFDQSVDLRSKPARAWLKSVGLAS